VGVKQFERTNPREETAKAARFDRKAKRHISIDCPQIVHEYNAHMGGVDLMDGLMGRYHIRAKTRDAATRIFYHLIDMAATNAYILHRRIQTENASKENILALPDFRETLAAGLVTYKNKNFPGRPINTKNASSPRWGNQSPSSQSGRTINSPSSHAEWAKQSPLSHRPFQHELKQGQKSKHPISDLRFDQLNHFPHWLDRNSGKRCCKHCKSSQTQCICTKCNLHLCCTANKNCFLEYHKKK